MATSNPLQVKFIIAVSRVRPGLHLGQELEDVLHILLRRFSVGRGFPPLGAGNQPVHQFCTRRGWISLFPGMTRVGVRILLSISAVAPRVG